MTETVFEKLFEVMKTVFNSKLLFVFILSILFWGCAGQTKPFIPDKLPQLKSELSRIVLTREKQIAGAGSPMVVIDVGNNIEPNAMMHILHIDMDKILHSKKVASGPNAPVDFMWFNFKVVPQVYCPNNEKGCIKYHWRWPKVNSNGFLMGDIAVIRNDCEVNCGDKGLFLVGPWKEKCPQQEIPDMAQFFKNEIKLVDIVEEYLCPSFPDKHKYGFKDACLNNQAYILTSQSLNKFKGDVVTIDGEPGIAPRFEPLEADEYSRIIDAQKIARNIQVIGTMEIGDTLIWDRKPGLMRLGAVWYDGVGFIPENIEVDAGKTYFLHYTTRMGQRWELKMVK